MNKPVVLCVLVALSLIACESKKEKIKEETTPVPTELKPAEVAKQATEKIPVTANNDADKVASPVEAAPTKPGAATDTVVRKTWGKTLPQGFALEGKPRYFVSWTDRNGLNGFALTYEDKPGHDGILRARFAHQKEDGSWEDWRALKEFKDCSSEMDLNMETYMDKAWSLTDLDADGDAELTFAWAVLCSADVGPYPHKIFILEKQDKYALRGESRVRLSETSYLGGTFKKGTDFDKAPKGFYEHARKVWNATSDKTND